MYNEIQKLNDKYLELDAIITEMDKALGQTVEIETVYEDETGRHRGTARVLDEDSIWILSKLLDRLEKVRG